MDFRYYVAFISEWLGVVAIAWLLAMSPRFQKPQVGFRYARRDGVMALMLYALILAFAFIFYSIDPPNFPDTLRLAPAPVHNFQQALILAVISVLPFIAALVIRQQPVRAIGWNLELLRPGLQMGIAMAALTIFLRNRVMDVLGGLAGPTLSALLLAIGISLLEETIFRGYIQVRLTWWLGQNLGLVVTSALFALWHAVPWMRTLPVETTLILALLTFVQGLILGWIMRKAGQVIAPALYRAFSIWMQFFV